MYSKHFLFCISPYFLPISHLSSLKAAKNLSTAAIKIIFGLFGAVIGVHIGRIHLSTTKVPLSFCKFLPLFGTSTMELLVFWILRNFISLNLPHELFDESSISAYLRHAALSCPPNLPAMIFAFAIRVFVE